MNNSSNQEFFTEVIEHIVELLTPNNCFICGQPGGACCQLCLLDLPGSMPVCYSCSARSDNYLTCAACKKSSAKPSALYHMFSYKDETKNLISKMKFYATREVATLLGKELADFLPKLAVDAVVPIPTSPSRVRQRGYDQAVRIAKSLSSTMGWRYAEILRRSGKTRQVGANKATRRQQAALTLGLKKNINLNSVLLVDDVVSSGATIEAATKLLKSSGVKVVYAAVITRRA